MYRSLRAQSYRGRSSLRPIEFPSTSISHNAALSVSFGSIHFRIYIFVVAIETTIRTWLFRSACRIDLEAIIYSLSTVIDTVGLGFRAANVLFFFFFVPLFLTFREHFQFASSEKGAIGLLLS